MTMTLAQLTKLAGRKGVKVLPSGVALKIQDKAGKYHQDENGNDKLDFDQIEAVLKGMRDAPIEVKFTERPAGKDVPAEVAQREAQSRKGRR